MDQRLFVNTVLTFIYDQLDTLSLNYFPVACHPCRQPLVVTGKAGSHIMCMSLFGDSVQRLRPECILSDQDLTIKPMSTNVAAND